MPWSGQIGSQLCDALGVVPHPVGVDDPAAGGLGDAEHPAVDVRRHPGDHRAAAASPSRSGQVARTRSWLPPMPPRVTTTAWRPQLELARPRSGGWAAAPGGRWARAPPRARRRRRRRRPSARRPGAGSANPTSPARRARGTRRSNGASTPGPVPQVRWKRGTELPWPVGAPVAAALGPADHGKNRRPMRVQPGPLLAGGEVDVRLGPAARPVVLGRGRTGRCPASPARPARGSPGCPSAAARGCRRGTARRGARTPGRRGTAPAPGRAAAPG